MEGEFYNLSLLPPIWAPGPIDCADPPVDVAAVNPWMLRMAAEVADGVHVHPLNTPTYLRETVLPEPGGRRRPLPGAASRTSRSSSRPSWCVGDTEEERARWRELARVQVAFYGSTPNYAFIFEQLDREGTTDLIRERQRAGDIAGMAAVIDDDLLENFVTEGTWDDIADTIVAKYGGIATRVVSYFTGIRRRCADPDAFERWGALARRVRALSSRRRRRSRVVHPVASGSPWDRTGAVSWTARVRQGRPAQAARSAAPPLARGAHRGRQNRVAAAAVPGFAGNGQRIDNNDDMEGLRWLSN